MAIQISGTTVIDNSRNVNAGIVTATSFSGNGSALTALVANAINGVSVYTSPGTFTVGTNCPSSITSIIAYACGGGAPGLSGPTSPPSIAIGGAGGGASMTGCYFIPTSNGQVFSITIGGVSGTTTITRGPATIASIPGGSASPFPAPQTGTFLGGSAGSADPLANFNLGGGHGGHGSSSPDFPSTIEMGGYGGNSYFGTGGKGGTYPGTPPAPGWPQATAGSGAGAGGGGGGAGAGAAGAPGQVVIMF